MKKLFAFFFLLLLSAPAFATDVKPIDLGRNVQVWFVEDHTLPIVSVAISFPAGSAYDPAGKAGLADFTASLLNQGAGSRTA